MTIFGKSKTSGPHDGGPSRWGQRGTAAATIASRVTFENITRAFDDKHALRGVSLDIEPGEIICLLGPSGCGKTTLLRIAAGIERPDSGLVLLDGNIVAGPGKFVAPELRNVGLMFQDFALFPHLTIEENVAFGLRSLAPAAALEEAHAALGRVGLIKYAKDYPHILSGGEQQRVALARAIAPRPSVLLMDEPFSGLDAELRTQMQEETLAILQETRTTCIIVTHQPEEAMQLGDRIAVMKAGRIVQLGPAEVLYYAPKDLYVARLFSDIDEIAGVVENGSVATPLGNFDAAGHKDGARVVVSIRQRAIELTSPDKGTHGRVLNLKFLGDAARLEIALDGLDEPLRARVPEADAPEIGADVGVMVDSSAVLVFPAD